MSFKQPAAGGESCEAGFHFNFLSTMYTPIRGKFKDSWRDRYYLRKKHLHANTLRAIIGLYKKNCTNARINHKKHAKMEP